jgi:release factor glutamine methyltransferase
VTIWEALRQAESAISSQGIPDARAETEVLLMHALGLNRAELYARLKETLPHPQGETFWDLVEQRRRRRPTPYITGHCRFYGIDFHVDERALIPRPETELLVDSVLGFAEQSLSEQPCLIADVGTGSGVVAVALALHLPHARIYATDISPESLEVARLNVRTHGVENRVELLVGDLLETVPVPVDIIVANLPYVRDSDIADLMPEIRDFEPKVALSAGPDGLDKIRLLMAEAKRKLRPHGMISLEIGHGQGPAVVELARSHFPGAGLDLIPDLAGTDRILTVRFYDQFAG